MPDPDSKEKPALPPRAEPQGGSKEKTVVDWLAEASQLPIQERLKIYNELYWREQKKRQELIDRLTTGENGVYFDQKDGKFYTTKAGLSIEISEGIPPSLMQARRELLQTESNIQLLKEFYNSLDDKQWSMGGGGSGGGGTGGGRASVVVDPRDEAVERYYSLAKAMLDVYRNQQTYNINQAKEQRERIKFARETGIEPWFNHTPAPLGRNFGAPLEQETVEQAQNLSMFSNLANAYGAAAGMYRGFASGTRKPARLSAMLRGKYGKC